MAYAHHGFGHAGNLWRDHGLALHHTEWCLHRRPDCDGLHGDWLHFIRIVDFQDDCVVLVGDNATKKDTINIYQILGKAVCKAPEMPMINRITKDYSCFVHGFELKGTIVDSKLLGFQLCALPEQV